MKCSKIKDFWHVRKRQGFFQTRAQISTEFVIILTAALIVFLIIFAIIDKRNDELYSKRTMLYAREESDKLASSINTIFLAGDGARKTVLLPETLKDGKNYTIDIYTSSNLIEITWSYFGDKHYSSALITSNISGSLNSLRNTSLTISNSNGGIIIG